MRLLAAALVLLMFTTVSGCKAQAQPSEAEFAAAMIPRLQAALPDAELASDPDDPLAIKLDKWNDMEDAQINLHRIYGYCLNATAQDCETVSAEFIEKITYRPPPPEAKDLRVIVRDSQYWAYVEETFAAKGTLPPHRRIGEDLYAILAFDSPETITLAQGDDLKEMGLEGDAAWVLAQRQTAAILPPLPDGAAVKKQGVAFQDFEYLPSMLVDSAGWDRLARQVGPDLFVTAVSDGFVFVGLMPAGPGLDEFRKTVQEDCNAQPRCISPNIYRWRNGRWVIAR